MFSASNWPPPERAAQGEAPLLRAALGIVRGLSGADVTVELYPATGGGAWSVSAPAVLHADYQAGDAVLVVFQSEDADSAVVVGRVGDAVDRFTAANVLARLLAVDGAGSALDADTVDGQHESALLRADGTRALTGDWDVGGGRALKTATVRARAGDGLALEDDGGGVGLFVEDGGQVGIGHRAPQCPLDVKSAGDGLIALFLADDGADTAGFGLYAYTDDYATSYLANATLFYATLSTSALILAAANAAGEIRFTTGGSPSATTERMRLTNAGLGIGVTSAQGRLHVHDGEGGFLFASKTAIGATAQVIVPNGAGDVTALVRIEAIVGNGSSTAFLAFSLDAGGVTTQNATLGGDTYQFRLNADGSVDIRRTAGSSAGKVTLRAMWV